MAQFIEIYTGEDRVIVVNVDRVESIEKIIEKNGDVSYSVVTNLTRYLIDEAGTLGLRSPFCRCRLKAFREALSV